MNLFKLITLLTLSTINVKCHLLENLRNLLLETISHNKTTLPPQEAPLYKYYNFGSKKYSKATVAGEYYKDLVLNSVNSKFKNMRRKAPPKTSSELDSSSSNDVEKLSKEAWKELWIKKKFEAINSTVFVPDSLNMGAARPWGVACGDPKQHDAPWGTCMLPMECEGEYRIYRGDYLCGDTQFICCALQKNTYDLYQAFDVSFEDSELSTDTEEKRGGGDTAEAKRRRRRDKNKRRRERARRKRKIKKQIRRIVHRIKKILNSSYRNATTEKKKKTKQLKKFINYLKQKFKDERLQAKIAHEIEVFKIDTTLQKKLQSIKELNSRFVSNNTNQSLIGTVSPVIPTKKNARRSNKGDYFSYEIM